MPHADWYETALIAMVGEVAVMLVYVLVIAFRGNQEMIRRAVISAIITVVVGVIFNGLSLLLNGCPDVV